MNLGRYTHALLRIGVGVLFLQHGLQKIFGLLGGVNTHGATVPLQSMYGAAGVLEVIGAPLVIIGLFTRPVALVLLVEMLTAYFTVHTQQGGWPVQNQGELALLYGLAFAFLAGNGAGPLSIDELTHFVVRERRRHPDRRHPFPAPM